MKILTGVEAVAAIHALNDESRRQILNALKANTMTTSEIVEFLSTSKSQKDIKPQTVRYHLKELERSGLIQQEGFTSTGNGDSHIMTKLWRATAEHLFLATGSISDIPIKTEMGLAKSLDTIGTMKKLGFILPEKKRIEEIAKKFVEWDNLWNKGREESVRTLNKVSEIEPDVYVTLRRIISIIQLSETDYERYWEVSREVTDIFRKAYQEGKGKNPEVY